MKTLFLALLVGLALLASGMTKVLEAVSRLATDHRVEIRAAMNSDDAREIGAFVIFLRAVAQAENAGINRQEAAVLLYDDSYAKVDVLKEEQARLYGAKS